jgi:hypothetical protein
MDSRLDIKQSEGEESFRFVALLCFYKSSCFESFLLGGREHRDREMRKVA